MARLRRPVETPPPSRARAVAEHAVTLMMALNRNLRKSTDRTRKLNFELSGLTGHDIKSRTVGVVGTGKVRPQYPHATQL